MRYRTAEAFRMSLETRLKQKVVLPHLTLARLRRTVAFERLLARLFTSDEPHWLLKGGFAMETRLPKRARLTRDIDLSVPLPLRVQLDHAEPESQMQTVQALLQEAASQDLQDYFTYTIGAPMHDLDNAPYGGARFPVQAHLERPFIAFHMDVALGDVNIGRQEWLIGENLLDFAEAPAPRFAAITREQQFAEKIHAYTLPRERENSRVKDLVDLLLLLDFGLPDEGQLKMALRETFTRRRTHDLPLTLAAPPSAWEKTFADFASECTLTEKTLTTAYQRLEVYWQSLAMANNNQQTSD